MLLSSRIIHIPQQSPKAAKSTTKGYISPNLTYSLFVVSRSSQTHPQNQSVERWNVHLHVLHAHNCRLDRRLPCRALHHATRHSVMPLQRPWCLHRRLRRLHLSPLQRRRWLQRRLRSSRRQWRPAFKLAMQSR